MSGEIKITGLDHVSIAVPDLAEGIRRWSAILGRPPDGTEEVPSERVRVAFFPVGETRIELVAPGADDSPIAGYLDKRGGGIHHLCLTVEDADAAWARLSDQGVRLIGDGPHEGAGGARIFFLHPAATGGALVEIKEDDAPHRS